MYIYILDLIVYQMPPCKQHAFTNKVICGAAIYIYNIDHESDKIQQACFPAPTIPTLIVMPGIPIPEAQPITQHERGRLQQKLSLPREMPENAGNISPRSELFMHAASFTRRNSKMRYRLRRTTEQKREPCNDGYG